jgi:hypothetical protein
MIVRRADSTIRELFIATPARRWPGVGLDFPCPNPHCYCNREATVEHLQAHSDQHWDALFHNPFIATLAGLIGCRLEMSDGAGFICPFFGDGCDFRPKSITELDVHLVSIQAKAKSTSSIWEYSAD